MATVTTTRPVDSGQLVGEIGASVRIADLGDRLEVTADIPQAALQAAIDAHVPEEPSPSEIALMQQQVNELTDLIIFGL